MNETPISLKCKKCSQSFQLDVKTRGDWICPNCQTKNPNLKRHYRSVADLYILWLIFSAIFSFIHFQSVGLDIGVIFSLPFLILLIVTIVFIYKSQRPWNDKTVRILIWLAFGTSLGFKSFQTIVMLITDRINIPFIISFGLIYTAIFLYLFWLHLQTRKYAV